MSLKDKRVSMLGHYMYPEEDVKEFIKKLKEEFCRCHLVCLTNVKCVHCQFIEKETGDFK